MLNTRFAVRGWLAETFPEDTNQQVTVGNFQNRVNQSRWAIQVKARIRISFPPRQFKVQSTISGPKRLTSSMMDGSRSHSCWTSPGDATTTRRTPRCGFD